jgi:hypothetical protein
VAPSTEPHDGSEFVNTDITFRPIFKLTFFLYYWALESCGRFRGERRRGHENTATRNTATGISVEFLAARHMSVQTTIGICA